MTNLATDQVGVLVMSHGTPKSLDELEGFYTEIRRGSPPPRELLADLERRYLAIGGASPLTERTAAQVAGISRSLERLSPGRFVVVSGSRFSPPRIEDAVSDLVRRGVPRAIGVVLAPHSSVVSVGEYARRARAAADASGASGSARADGIEMSEAVADARQPFTVEVVDHWYDAPGLVELIARRVRDATERVREAVPDTENSSVEVIFTAHSVPSRLVQQGDTYADQVRGSAESVATYSGLERWSVAWQSAGRTGDEWLGPDIKEAIESIASSGATGVVVCPIGFVSDHLEVLYDLDIEAARVAERVGVAFARTASLNDDPAFCELIARLVIDTDRKESA